MAPVFTNGKVTLQHNIMFGGLCVLSDSGEWLPIAYLDPDEIKLVVTLAGKNPTNPYQADIDAFARDMQ